MTTHDPFAPIAPKHKTIESITNLSLKEEVFGLTGDQSTTVKDKKTKKVLYKIGKSSTFFTGHRRILKDVNGREIGQFRRDRMAAIHKSYFIGINNDEKRCSIRLKQLGDVAHRHADIYLGEDIIGEAFGADWKEKKFEIKIKDKVVANVYKTLDKNVKGFLHEDDFCMDITSEGVDTAFITMITLALDELYQDKM